LAVGVGTIALVIGLLAVFGHDRGRSTPAAVAEATNAEVVSPTQSSRPSSTVTTTARRADAAVDSGEGAPANSRATAAQAANGAASVAPGAATDGAAAPAATNDAPTAPGAATPPPPAPTPPPTTAAPVSYPSATVAPGPGGTITVMLADFPPNTTVSIACYHIIVGQGVEQFDSYSATTDGSGSSTTSSCVWSQPGTHAYVVVTGPGIAGSIGSNHYQFA
jgi:hypothetical protein